MGILRLRDECVSEFGAVGAARWAATAGARTVGLQLVDQLVGDFGQPPFIGVGQPRREFRNRHPRDLGDLKIIVGEFSAQEPHQVVVHGLVHTPAVGDEPIVDATQRGEHAAANAGFLGDLADRGLFGGFTHLDVALGQ